eukprot:PhM_4_TR3890/c0_g1_i1/m.77374
MGDVSYYDETLSSDLRLLQASISTAENLDGADRDAAVKDLVKSKQGIRNRLLQFKTEVRMCKDPTQKQLFERRLGEHEEKLKELDQGIQNVRKPKKVTFDAPVGPTDAGDISQLSSGRQLLERGVEIQDETYQSILRSQRTVQNTEETAIAAEVELGRQRDVLNTIDQQLDHIETTTKRASREVRWFARALATDKFFMCIFFVVVCLAVTIVALKFYDKYGSGGGDDEVAPVPAPAETSASSSLRL